MAHQALDPARLEAMEVYRLLTNFVVPRPIAFVSSVSAEGVANLAPFSYFNLGGINPPSLVFSPVTSPGDGDKDTLVNIRATGEYVINLVTLDIVMGMNETSFGFPSHVDEWEVSGLTPVPSAVVGPARVLESPVSFECRLFEVVSHGAGPGAANYVIGEVVQMHVEESVLGAMEEFPAVSRLGGPHYLDLGAMERFSLERPTGGG